MNRNKAVWHDRILLEIILSLNVFKVDKITEIINEIYESGDILENPRKSKTPGAFSLTRHIIKLKNKILMNGAPSRI